MNSSAVERIRARLQETGCDGYVAYTPSNIRYVTGFGSYFVSEWWRMHGTVFAVVPAAPERPVSLVVSDFESQTARLATDLPHLSMESAGRLRAAKPSVLPTVGTTTSASYGASDRASPRRTW
jgi:Xaa-Pro aminopeptidase